MSLLNSPAPLISGEDQTQTQDLREDYYLEKLTSKQIRILNMKLSHKLPLTERPRKLSLRTFLAFNAK